MLHCVNCVAFKSSTKAISIQYNDNCHRKEVNSWNLSLATFNFKNFKCSVDICMYGSEQKS